MQLNGFRSDRLWPAPPIIASRVPVFFHACMSSACRVLLGVLGALMVYHALVDRPRRPTRLPLRNIQLMMNPGASQPKLGRPPPSTVLGAPSDRPTTERSGFLGFLPNGIHW